MPSKRSRQTWIAIAIAAVVILIVLGLVVAGGSAYFVARHIHAQTVSAVSAEEQLTRGRERFAGQTPLIEIGDDGEPVVHRPPADAARAPLTALHALVYNAESGKLLTINVPMWLLRMMPAHNRFMFVNDDLDFDSRRTRVTVEDLERHGPGLILDGQARDGARILIWAE
jgi:hypothetical protein